MSRARTLTALAAALAAVVTTALPVPPASAAVPVPRVPPVDTVTTTELAGYVTAGSPGAARADDSVTSGTQCMRNGPVVATAYRTDGIMLRGKAGPPTPTTAAQFRAAVVSALAAVPGTTGIVAGAAEVLQVPGDTVPVAHVPLSGGSGAHRPVVALARWLHDNLHGGWQASPNHLLSSFPSYLMFPDGGPRPTATTMPSRAATLGTGTTVAVYDTGQPVSNAAAVAGATPLTTGDIEPVDTDRDGIVDRYYTGHSQSISGVLHAFLPAAAISLVKVTDAQDVPTDLSVLRRMVTAIQGYRAPGGRWPDVMVTPFGTAACDVTAGGPYTGRAADQLVPVGLDSVARGVRASGRSLIVASAGNESSARAFYPAAFDGVLSVGALDAGQDTDGNATTSPVDTGGPAWFSNYGPWVKAWVPGANLPMPWLSGLRYDPKDPPLQGQVLWSGTSFAAPVMAALVDEQLGVLRSTVPTATPSDAWTGYLRAAGPPCTSVGGGTALTLADVTTPAGARRTQVSVC